MAKIRNISFISLVGLAADFGSIYQTLHTNDLVMQIFWILAGCIAHAVAIIWICWEMNRYRFRKDYKTNVVPSEHHMNVHFIMDTYKEAIGDMVEQKLKVIDELKKQAETDRNDFEALLQMIAEPTKQQKQENEGNWAHIWREIRRRLLWLKDTE